MRSVIEKQFVSNERLDDMDIMSIAYQHGLACVQVMFIRQGKVLGNRSYFPKSPPIRIYRNLPKLLWGNFIYKVIKDEVSSNSIIVDRQLAENQSLSNFLRIKLAEK